MKAQFGSSQHPRTSAVSRREFLRYGSAGGLGVWGLSFADAASAHHVPSSRRSCIFIVLTGGPSQFETFDPKPEANSSIRGPFLPVATTVPGLWLSETLPHLSQRAEMFSLLRSLTHHGAPIHETGLQLIQTGGLTHKRRVPPSIGAVVASRAAYRGNLAPHVVLPALLDHTGVQTGRGQTGGVLGQEWEPRTLRILPEHHPVVAGESPEERAWQAVSDLGTETAAIRLKYGSSEFGRNCLAARRLVEQGVPFVTINMFDSLANRVTWDCHAVAPLAPTRFSDYRDTVCPHFDTGLSALLEDLHQRGLLESTLVVAVGEMGRTPKLNRHGGRDHWTKVFSALIAGCGFPGGQVLGSSDADGAHPQERPIQPAELVATIYAALGIDPSTELTLADGSKWPLIAGAAPLIETA
ncbi:MAG: hypothetical protein JWM11_6222 [Planctomycetaceae bacterium]|nr:hypothetical protein [Planctomycetaceae bacterium]